MNKLLRIIDANLNRSQEGVRVCEDIVRFVLDEKALSRSFKAARHTLGGLAKSLSRLEPGTLKTRNVRRDVGRASAFREGRRKNIVDVFHANAQRTKESLRVLEEVTKLVDRKIAERFKKVRFRLYELEKKSRVKLEALLHNR